VDRQRPPRGEREAACAANVYRELGVANRAGAVRYALEHQLASVQDDP
jgi:hypothetical protein